VNDDALKLTTYFGERHRTDRALVADELLDLYERRRVEVSVLLRGVEGFGRRHHLRTDRLLTLSEDLPVVSVAVDTRERITALLDDLLAIKRHGLVTLERARLLAGRLEAATVPGQLRAEAAKLTVYIGRQHRVQGAPGFVAVCELLHRRQLAGATVLLGVDGTVRGIRRRARFFARNADVPMMIIAVGSGERLAAVLPELGEMLGESVVTLERVRICKRDGETIAPLPEVPAHDESGMPLWQKLMIYSSEDAQYGGSPVHVALVRALRESGGRGATSLRGIWGFHGDHPPHGDRLLQLRRHVPVVTTVIESPERIAEAFSVVDEVTRERGLVTSEIVPAATEIEDGRCHGGLGLAKPARPADR
jgi:PII-like signaling protein